MEDRSKRQEWGPGDVQYTPAQCGECLNADMKNSNNCKEYGKKPEEYTSGPEECPKRIYKE